MKKSIRIKSGFKFVFLFISIFIFIQLSGCAYFLEEKEETDSAIVSTSSIAQKTQIDIADVKLRDNKYLYTKDIDTEVETMYLTIKKGNATENTNHTWTEINTYSVYDYQKWGVDRYKAAALLQIGDENGPIAGELGFEETGINADVQIRGQTSSRNAQKNYRITLKDNKGLYKEQKVINLNKHMSDGLRFRNKLIYDLLETVPQLMAARTQFVHLYVRDESEGAKAEFVDYGLYTQVEQLNKRYLRNHGLDPNAHFYKLNYFEFFPYEDIIVQETDPRYDEKKFEEYIESKGNADHTKLINLLQKINDSTVSGDDLLDTYFDEENIAYWMGFMILVGNKDTQSRNTFVYSPYSSQKWYFIPWDNDGALVETENLITERMDGLEWESGISNYWGNVLYRKLLMSERFRKALDLAINDLRNNYVNSDIIMPMVEQYTNITEPYLMSMPDMMYSRLTPEQREYVIGSIPRDLEHYYENYITSSNRPMPFFIGSPILENGKLKITWQNAHDFKEREVVYNIEISNNLDFEGSFFSQTGLRVLGTELDAPPPGQYFIKVRAINSDRESQVAFDYYLTVDGKRYGIKSIYINPDGSISEETYEE